MPDLLINYELNKMINRVQELSTKKEYTYNKMECINSKPALQAGNENLIEYNIKLPLHINFCDVEEWISIIEQQAQSREPFDWIYHGKYMGLFLIDSVEKSYQNRINDIVIYAEVSFNLLEVPVYEEFLEQIPLEIDLSEIEQYEENSNKFKSFAQKVKDAVVNSVKDAVATSFVSDNLTEASKEILSSSFEAIVGDFKNSNDITSIYTRVTELAKHINQNKAVDLADILTVNEIIKEIPLKALNASLRQGGGF